RALTVPSPASGCDTKWNWSPVPQMSPPPPCTVQVEPFRDCVPAGVAPPTSAHVHPLGQALGGGGALLATLTVSSTTVPSVFATCELTAIPASIGPDGPRSTVD